MFNYFSLKLGMNKNIFNNFLKPQQHELSLIIWLTVSDYQHFNCYDNNIASQ